MMRVVLTNIKTAIVFLVEIICIFMIIAFSALYFIFKKGDFIFFVTSILLFSTGCIVLDLIRRNKIPLFVTNITKVDNSSRLMLGLLCIALGLSGFYYAYSNPNDKLLGIFGGLLFGLGGIGLLIPNEKENKTRKENKE
ncbi:MAG: hypothetical protein Q7K98_02805 [Candidatus Omnitrophota bacterium]|nr:hypothetical protein [Candidatus Omnitrophota bacterium]